MEEATIDELVTDIGCSKLEWPFVYLDIPLGGNLNSKHFQRRVENKIAKWLES